MYREGILVCLKENIFWSVPEITGSMAGHEPVRECGLLAINDTCVIKWFGSFGHNEWCFIDNNLLGQYSLLSQNLQKYIPCKEDCILVCLKENVFLLVPEITGSMACWT